jgi:hypothetical protein
VLFLLSRFPVIFMLFNVPYRLRPTEIVIITKIFIYRKILRNEEQRFSSWLSGQSPVQYFLPSTDFLVLFSLRIMRRPSWATGLYCESFVFKILYKYFPFFPVIPRFLLNKRDVKQLDLRNTFQFHTVCRLPCTCDLPYGFALNTV